MHSEHLRDMSCMADTARRSSRAEAAWLTNDSAPMAGSAVATGAAAAVPAGPAVAGAVSGPCAFGSGARIDAIARPDKFGSRAAATCNFPGEANQRRG